MEIPAAISVAKTSAARAGFRPVRQPEAGQRHAGKTETEFL
jgi:hypothetical protein